METLRNQYEENPEDQNSPFGSPTQHFLTQVNTMP